MNTRVIREQYLDVSIAEAYDKARFNGAIGRAFDWFEKRALKGVVRRALADIEQPVVLDVPCGTGRITELLLGEGLNVTGGDISPAMLQVAQAKLGHYGARVTWRQIDLEHLVIDDNSVDLVTCIRLFHHIHSDARIGILRELARVTRRFVIVNVSFSSPAYRLRRRLKRILGQGVSTASSTTIEIEREARSAGLQIEARRFVLPFVSEDLVLLLRKA